MAEETKWGGRQREEGEPVLIVEGDLGAWSFTRLGSVRDCEVSGKIHLKGRAGDAAEEINWAKSDMTEERRAALMMFLKLAVMSQERSWLLNQDNFPGKEDFPVLMEMLVQARKESSSIRTAPAAKRRPGA